MSNKLQLRRDTAANWEAANPVLAQGEIGLILDSNGKVVGQKIGDGVTEWKELPNHESSFLVKALGLESFTQPSIIRNEGYVAAKGVIVGGSLGFYSEAIHVESGTLVLFTASSSSAMSAISDITNGEIRTLVLGSTSPHEIGYMYYFVERDMDLIFSGYAKESAEVKLYNGDSVLKRMDALKKQVLPFIPHAEDIYQNFSNVGYIDNRGNVRNITAYKYTDPIALPEGSMITFKTNIEYINVVSLISIKDGDAYIPKILGESVEPDAEGYWTYCYTAEHDCEIVLTKRNISSKETYIINYIGVTGDIEILKQKVKSNETDKYRLAALDKDNPLKRISTSPGMTSAIRSWGFIGDSLSSGEIWGYNCSDIGLVAQDADYKIDTNGEKVSAAGYNISQPINLTGTYPMLYLSLCDAVFAKSDESGTIGEIVATTSTSLQIYTNFKALNQGDYVRISYPSGISSVKIQSRYIQDNYDISWGQFLCRLCGSEGYNYSIGGRQAKTFVNGTSERDMQKLLADNQKQAYTIALGQNDQAYINGVGDEMHYKEMGSAEEGSSEFVTILEPKNHGDTFVGYYSEIICQIKRKFRDSLIFLVTCPNTDGSRDEISGVIRQIYEHYSKVFPNQIYLIDLNQYGKGLTDDFKLNGLHLNSQGYLLAAYAINTYVDWILRNNINELNGLPLIGTGAYRT